ncbi:MAG: chloride channel protein [Chloroflexi bacterium]|nr:chloride channel protein [Chloroflexota bacterium]
MTTMAVLVGLGGGLGTVLFRKAVEAAMAASAQVTSAGGIDTWSALFLPALGGLVVGLWIHWIRPKGPGQGVAGIMEAVHLHAGRIEPRGAIGRVIGAVITIGSGGSAGPEDPSVQIGATLGSLTSQFFRLSPSRVKTLIGCGAAAGISAAFNAPIAGVFFAIELILGEFSSAAIGYVVMSAVAGAVVSQTFLGSQPAFQVPTYELKSPLELGLYGVLGIFAALVAVLYINLLQYVEATAERPSPIPDWVKPALGGLVVGMMGFFIRPEIFGIGYSVIQNVFLHPTLDWTVFIGLVFLKLLATTVTLGSGGQGGLFAPSLFLGALLGVGFAVALNTTFPGLALAPAAYGMVGMAAIVAGAVRAPITAIVLPFEMTNDYRVIVPLMTSAVLSYLIAQRLQPFSVYTQKLRRRGIDLHFRKDENLMRAILVGEAMTPLKRVIPVQETLPIQQLAVRFQKTGFHGFPVVDQNGRLAGVVALQDLERATAQGHVEGVVGDICTHDVITAFPDESLEEALGKLGAQDVGRIPVVDRRDSKRLVGVLRRSDITRAYTHALVDETDREHHVERLRLEGITGMQFVELTLDEKDVAAGRKLGDLKLPPEAILVSVRRNGRIIIPRGGTVLLAGDHILAAAMPARLEQLQNALTGQPEHTPPADR